MPHRRELGRKAQNVVARSAANPNKAAPAGWVPGKPVIDTGKDAIGNY